MSFNVAIDGPAGAGKSTVARALAEKMGLVYVDTGAMYRAIALCLLRTKTALDDMDAVGTVCEKADIEVRYEGGVQTVYLNGENVNAFLRTEEVGNVASRTSALLPVRKKLVELQKKIAAGTDCVMDGRDIGTVVLPKADVKIYLTADSAVRARRRYDELRGRGEECSLEKIREDIEERDYRDMHRKNSPLTQAKDAVLLDTSGMTAEEATDEICRICAEKRDAGRPC